MNSDQAEGYFLIIGFLAAIIIALFVGVTNKKDAGKALDAMGFTNVEYTGYNFFACSDDWYHTGFKAINPQGKTVEGTVCSGLLFKNSSVRFDK